MTDFELLEQLNYPPAHMGRLDRAKYKQVLNRMELDEQTRIKALEEQSTDRPSEPDVDPTAGRQRLEPGSDQRTENDDPHTLTPLEKALIKRFNRANDT